LGDQPLDAVLVEQAVGRAADHAVLVVDDAPVVIRAPELAGPEVVDQIALSRCRRTRP
jgi:hypothetical protein